MEMTKDQKERVNGAKDAIDAILDNFKVQLVPQLMIIGGQIVQHTVGMVPEPEDNRIVVPKIDPSKLH